MFDSSSESNYGSFIIDNSGSVVCITPSQVLGSPYLPDLIITFSDCDTAPPLFRRDSSVHQHQHGTITTLHRGSQPDIDGRC